MIELNTNKRVLTVSCVVVVRLFLNSSDIGIMGSKTSSGVYVFVSFLFVCALE